MGGLSRIVIVMMVALTVVYVSLFFYLRSGARMRLEEDWVRAGRPGEREDWVDERVRQAAGRIRVWLVVFVYVIPLVAVVAFIWATN